MTYSQKGYPCSFLTSLVAWILAPAISKSCAISGSLLYLAAYWRGVQPYLKRKKNIKNNKVYLK